MQWDSHLHKNIPGVMMPKDHARMVLKSAHSDIGRTDGLPGCLKQAQRTAA